MKLVVLVLSVVSLAAASDDYYGPPPSLPAHPPIYSAPVQHSVPVRYQQELQKPIYENHQHLTDQSAQTHQQNPQEKYIIMTYQSSEPQNQHDGYQNYGSPNINSHDVPTNIAEYKQSNNEALIAAVRNNHESQHIGHAVQQSVVPVGHNIEYTHPQVEYKAKTPKILEHQYQTNGHAYEYRYHTENGIQAHEVGEIGKSSTVKGAYSYVGDDGKSYTVSYIADEHGFRPHGDHLPTPPPIPAEIVQALEKNAKDEANGIVDDGQYHQHQQHHQTNQNTQEHQEYTIVDEHGYHH